MAGGSKRKAKLERLNDAFGPRRAALKYFATGKAGQFETLIMLSGAATAVRVVNLSMATDVAMRLFSIKLDPMEHRQTGKTRHFKAGGLLAPPDALEIVELDGGFYLYYLDANGRLQTDTWHRSLDDAFHQAEHEFGVTRSDWVAGPGGASSVGRT